MENQCQRLKVIIWPNCKYFDYSNSDIKSDFMDCFLLSKCKMFFGGSSGIGLLPASFRRPYFLINNCPLEGVFSIKRIYPTIFKRIKDLTGKVMIEVIVLNCPHKY